MVVFKFSSNWNKKLYGSYFTTIRKKSSQFKIGDSVMCVFEDANRIEFKGVIVHVADYKFCDIPNHVLMLDTGLSVDESIALFRKFYGEDLDFVTMSYYVIERVSKYMVVG